MSTAIAIVGMHRSGTSLVAGLLRSAGLPIGEILLPASASNPRGHHEDLPFVDLHDRMLADNGTDWTMTGAPTPLRWTDAYRSEAARLVAARGGHAAWGWKDPRTALFLPFWSELIENLLVVCIHRRAASVVASLRRRRDPPLVHRFRGAWPLRRLGLPMTRDGQAFRMWREYNLAALRFARRAPDRCAFVDADDLVARWPSLRAWLASRGVALAEVDLAAHIDPGLYRRRAPLDLELRALRPATRRVAAALRAATERSGDDGADRGAPRSRVSGKRW